MELFENKVGRPSNETLNKRKRFIIIVSGGVLVFIIAAVAVIFGGNSFSLTAGIGSSGQPQARSVWDGNNSRLLVYGCPSGYTLKKNDNNRCTKDVPEKYTLLKVTKNTKAKQKCNNLGYNSVTPEKTKYGIVWVCKDRQEIDSNKTFIPYYAQGNYASTTSQCYSSTSSEKGLNKKGCGPSTSAMLYAGLLNTTSIDPIRVNNYASQLCGSSHSYCNIGGTTICSGGSYYADFIEYFKYSLTSANQNKLATPRLYKNDSAGIGEIERYLKTGRCIGVAVLSSSCTKNNKAYCYGVGHFVIVATREGKYNVYVMDPGNKNNHHIEDTISGVISNTQNTQMRVYCRNS